jgi:predicted SprT family Zn-dependent metalloprotease
MVTYKEYLKNRFAEMKTEDGFKDLKPQEKTQIIAEEWRNRNEVTELKEQRETVQEVQKPNQIDEISSETEPEDKESKYKYKCSCGHYFNDIPQDGKCIKCGVDLI